MNMVLKVQPAKNKNYGIYRLGIGPDDSSHYFYKPLTITLVLSGGLTIQVNIACGPPTKKGYDVNSKDLSDWIKRNRYHIYPYGNPTELEFTYQKRGSRILLTFRRKL